MIDEEKVKLMTDAAMEDARDRRRKRAAVRYYPEDYVGIQVFKGAAGMTLLFLAVLGIWAMADADDWMTWKLSEIRAYAGRLVLLYVLLLAVTILTLILVYTLRYYQSRKLMRHEIRDLRRIESIYDSEERRERRIQTAGRGEKQVRQDRENREHVRRDR